MKRSKYNARKCVIDGITFDSLMEGARYRELRLLERAKKIQCLTVHPKYFLAVASQVLGYYEADFNYLQDGKSIVEDVKGLMTPLSRWKIKHAEAQYNFKVQIIRKTRVRRAA